MAKNQKQKKKKYSGQQQKEMDCYEPHLAPNEKTQPIHWTEWPTGALVAAGSLWPKLCCHHRQAASIVNKKIRYNFNNLLSCLLLLDMSCLKFSEY
jgi:hypothetical protein